MAAMSRSSRLTAAVILVCMALVALSIYLDAWGGLALTALVGGGFAWYRLQVARSEATDPFFGDVGDETRLTGLQQGSDLPSDHAHSRERDRPGDRQ
jgi:hypothetical protein